MLPVEQAAGVEEDSQTQQNSARQRAASLPPALSKPECAQCARLTEKLAVANNDVMALQRDQVKIQLECDALNEKLVQAWACCQLKEEAHRELLSQKKQVVELEHT